MLLRRKITLHEKILLPPYSPESKSCSGTRSSAVADSRPENRPHACPWERPNQPMTRYYMIPAVLVLHCSEIWQSIRHLKRGGLLCGSFVFQGVPGPLLHTWTSDWFLLFPMLLSITFQFKFLSVTRSQLAFKFDGFFKDSPKTSLSFNALSENVILASPRLWT